MIAHCCCCSAVVMMVVAAASVIRLGNFLKFLVTCLLSKVALMHGAFWAKVKSNTFHVKLLWLIIGQRLEKFGLLLNSVSGHSGGHGLAMMTRPRKWVVSSEKEDRIRGIRWREPSAAD